MVSVDEHTQVAIEIIAEATKLTEELILKVLQSVNNLFSKDNDKQDFAIKNNTKEGKQKIKELLGKHKDGVVALDENITNDQVKDYQNEFKKMGVDFSVIKSDKDSYSFFFASKDANIIEKTLKNIIEKKSKSIEKENDIEPPKEIIHSDKSRNDLDPNNIVNKEKQLIDSLNKLSPKEQALFSKMDELAALKSELTDEQIINVQNLHDEHSLAGKIELPKGQINNSLENNVKEKLDNVLRDEIEDKFPSKEAQLDRILNQLNPLEKDLFMQINKSELEKGPEFKEFHKLMDIRENLTSEQILKVNELHSKNVFNSEEGKEAPRGKIDIKDIEGIANNLTRQKETQAIKEKSPSIYSIKGIKEIDTKLKEQDKDSNKDKKRTQSLAR